MELKDSGERREFETGAVRDMQEGKGRCDLVPLDVAAKVIWTIENVDMMDDVLPEHGEPLYCISEFDWNGNTNWLYLAIAAFIRKRYYGSVADALLEVSIHFEDGARKYGEDNWKKGLPISCYIDSAVRHYLKWKRGDTDEPHDRAFMWNLMCCIWEHDNHK